MVAGKGLMEIVAHRVPRWRGLRQRVVIRKTGKRHRHIFRFVFPALEVFPVLEDEVSTKDKT